MRLASASVIQPDFRHAGSRCLRLPDDRFFEPLARLAIIARLFTSPVSSPVFVEVCRADYVNGDSPGYDSCWEYTTKTQHTGGYHQAPDRVRSVKRLFLFGDGMDGDESERHGLNSKLLQNLHMVPET